MVRRLSGTSLVVDPTLSARRADMPNEPTQARRFVVSHVAAIETERVPHRLMIDLLLALTVPEEPEGGKRKLASAMPPGSGRFLRTDVSCSKVPVC
jgi:hypothetical protein